MIENHKASCIGKYVNALNQLNEHNKIPFFCLLSVTILISKYLVTKKIELEPKSKGEETSFVVKCNGPCSGIDIELEDQYYSLVDLYASENEKPEIETTGTGSTCAECESLCSNQEKYVHKKICRSLTTTSDSFFVTLYAYKDHEKLDITFKGGNLRNVTNFGK